jgi:predicted XRE-type DNA-binding protein
MGGLTQEEAAARLGVTRPRLNGLMRGKLDKFSLDALVNLAAAAGFRLHIALEDGVRPCGSDPMAGPRQLWWR